LGGARVIKQVSPSDSWVEGQGWVELVIDGERGGRQFSEWGGREKRDLFAWADRMRATSGGG